MAERLAIWAATNPGVRRMPIPSVLPTMTARPKLTPRMRRRPGLAVVTPAVWPRMFVIGAKSLGLERHQDDVDRLSDVARRVARAARFELDVARLPAIHPRVPVRGVLDGAPRQMDNDRVRRVRVESFAGADVHPCTNRGDGLVLEQRLEAHSHERRSARLRSDLRSRSARREWLRLDEDERARVRAARLFAGRPVRFSLFPGWAVLVRNHDAGSVRDTGERRTSR